MSYQLYAKLQEILSSVEVRAVLEAVYEYMYVVSVVEGRAMKALLLRRLTTECHNAFELYSAPSIGRD